MNVVSTSRGNGLAPFFAWFLGSVVLPGILLSCQPYGVQTARSDDWVSVVRAQSDIGMEEASYDDEDVDEEPDVFRKRAAARRMERQKHKPPSDGKWFATAADLSDSGPGFISQAGHLALKTFGRNESITPIEIMPYVLTDEHFFFSDLRGFISNSATGGGNAGFGYRNIREDLNSWFGASLWYDADETTGKLYQQIGLSFEALVQRFEFRSNVYIPVTRSQTYSNTITNPHFVGHQLVYGQFIDQGKALNGVDVEAGYNLPIMDAHSLRGFVGYYHFDGGPNGALNGFKTRLEGVINNTVTASVLYTNDPLFGANLMVGCQFQFPFGDRHPTSKWNENAPSPFRFVERNYNVIVNREQTNNGNIVAINPNTNKAYVIDQVSANGNGLVPFAVGTQDGTADKPYSTLSAAQSAGADVIFVQGNSVLNQSITLNPGQRLIGAGGSESLPLPGGGSVNLPTLASAALQPQFRGVTGNAVTMASNSVVSGFTFSNINGDAIAGSGVDNGTIRNVTFSNITGNAINIANASGDFVVNGIAINGATADGVKFAGGTANLTISATVSGTQGDGIALSNMSDGTVNIHNTTIASTNGSGLVLNGVADDVNVTSLSTSQTSGTAISITGGASTNTYHFAGTTTIQTPNGVGFSLSGSAADVTVDSLKVTSTAGSNAVSLANSTGSIILSNLSVDTTNATGLSASGLTSLTISNGTLTTVNAPAVNIQSSTIDVSLSQVSVNGGPFGLSLDQDVGTFTIAGGTTAGSGGTIQNTTTGMILNTAGTFTANWVDLTTNGTGISSTGNNQVSLSNLEITNSTGFALDSLNDAVLMLQNSLLTGNGSIGGGTIREQVNTVATYQWLISGNTISDANGTAILMATETQGAGASLASTIQNNVIAAGRGGNSLINENWNGPLSTLVSTNTLTAQGSNMTGVNVQDISTTDTSVARITNNSMTFSDNQSTGVMAVGAGSNTFQIDTNAIVFNGVSGIGLHFNFTGTSTTWIYTNSITDKAGGATGMLFDNVAASSRIQMDNNQITLLSSDLTIHRGIVFTTVTPTIQFLSKFNNVVANATSGDAFIIPVNSSTGQLDINGTLVP